MTEIKPAYTLKCTINQCDKSVMKVKNSALIQLKTPRDNNYNETKTGWSLPDKVFFKNIFLYTC